MKLTIGHRINLLTNSFSNLQWVEGVDVDKGNNNLSNDIVQDDNDFFKLMG